MIDTFETAIAKEVLIMFRKILEVAFVTSALIISLPLSASAQEQAPYVMPEGVTVLTGKEILNIVIGNTLRGSKFSEYYAPDGRIGGKERNRWSYQGTWEIVDDRFCPRYPSSTTYKGCVTISISENDVTWYREKDGTVRWKSTLKSGNPKNL